MRLARSSTKEGSASARDAESQTDAPFVVLTIRDGRRLRRTCKEDSFARWQSRWCSGQPRKIGHSPARRLNTMSEKRPDKA
jgi:hypothetical protein